MPDGSSSVTIAYDHIEAAEPLIKEGVRKGLAALGFLIQEQAQINIRENGSIDTGSMLNSAYTETPDKPTRADAITKAQTLNPKAGIAERGSPVGTDQVKVAFTVEHAIYVELGTVHAQSKPFLSPAVEKVRPQAGQVIGKFIKEEVY